MLKDKISTILFISLLSGCEYSNTIVLCSANDNKNNITIDFDRKILKQSDFTQHLKSCAESTEDCFFGPFGFVNPEYLARKGNSEIPFSYKIKKIQNEYIVITEYSGVNAEYRFIGGEITELNLGYISRNKVISFKQCR